MGMLLYAVSICEPLLNYAQITLTRYAIHTARYEPQRRLQASLTQVPCAALDRDPRKEYLW